ncbi:hypothetical protein MKX03_026973 [Papaver bracteatum]|nr:hypothetical protein MKX03_026973 [Papaver bracteatum]
MTVFRGDPCTCGLTSNVAEKSSNGSATIKQECLIHPEGWKEEERSRRKAEIARFRKNKLEMERQKEEERIRSENIRCCSTRLLGEAL